jgi:enoyl-CoA hydratase/carnithine racemase
MPIDTQLSGEVDSVLTERRGSVQLLTLNRPDRLNAWNDDLEDAYFARLDEADNDPHIRAIVVTGAGRGFCAGADMSELQAAASEGADLEAHLARRPRSFPLTLRKPLIAAVNGAAVGLGLVEALYCDRRFCTPDAKLSTIFARRGLIAEYGISWLLPRIVGWSNASDLLLSGRIVLGEEAQRLGLVDHLAERDEVVDEAVAYASDLATFCSPASMAVIKAQLRCDLQTSLDSAIDNANQLLLESYGRSDVSEGVASHLQRRAPLFEPLPPRRSNEF